MKLKRADIDPQPKLPRRNCNATFTSRTVMVGESGVTGWRAAAWVSLACMATGRTAAGAPRTVVQGWHRTDHVDTSGCPSDHTKRRIPIRPVAHTRRCKAVWHTGCCVAERWCDQRRNRPRAHVLVECCRRYNALGLVVAARAQSPLQLKIGHSRRVCV
jgi:hypothetical protein